jgi:glycosyltransferase involved in cell wall biosynthesis
VVARHGPGQAGAHPPPGGGHLLYVGDDEPRKNLGLLRAAYRLYREAAADPLPLVLAGSAETTGPGVRVELSPAPERLATLYGQAAALVHPSLHEGFGLTALEAMAAGVPVIAARAPGIAETCGAAAVWVDSRCAEELAGAIVRVAGDPDLRAELAQRGRERAASFSWERSARAHIEAYTLALG